MKVFFTSVICMLIIGCSATPYNSQDRTMMMLYSATYYFSLQQVERSENASMQYGTQKIDTLLNNSKYQSYYEDNAVKILWGLGSQFISFSFLNKTDSTISISWDEAAFVDERRGSHRVIHSGVSYLNRGLSMAPSRVLKKSFYEDMIYPADYLTAQGLVLGMPSGWDKKPLFLDTDVHGPFLDGTYPTLEDFHKAVTANVGKSIQVLLPFRIGGSVNEYSFFFRVDSVSTARRKAETE